MAKTQVRSTNIEDGGVKRADLNTTTAGSAVVAKLIQGSGITLASTGADSGTGDVTITVTAGSVPTGTGFTHITGGVQDVAAATYVMTIGKSMAQTSGFFGP